MEAARASLTRALELRPCSASAGLDLARAQLAIGDLGGAVKAVDRVIAACGAGRERAELEAFAGHCRQSPAPDPRPELSLSTAAAAPGAHPSQPRSANRERAAQIASTTINLA